MLIDTHAHLYAEEFDIDREEVVKNALKNGVKKILLPNVDVESINLVLDLTVQYPDLCELMLGLHPCYVKDDFENQSDKIKSNSLKDVEESVHSIHSQKSKHSNRSSSR